MAPVRLPLNDEYRAAYRMGVPPQGLVRLARNAVLACFRDEPIKSALLVEIDTVTSEHAKVIEF